MTKHILDQDGNIIMLAHVMTIEQQTYDHNNLFWSRISAKMRDGSTEYLLSKSFTNKEERDASHVKAWRMITSFLPLPEIDFSKPIRARKR